MKRIKKINQASIIGIFTNLLLGIIKITLGFLTNSIAIMSDAVNNFSDSISAIITIITMQVASKGATKKHPFGFGRVEYFSGAIIAAIVLITGAEFLKVSVVRIFQVEKTNFSLLAIIILIISIVAKIILGKYTKKIGTVYHSVALIASGDDALSDAVITAVTLFGALITLISGYNLDGILGVFVSLVILKTGVEILWDIISKLLGERNDIELAQKLIAAIKEYDQILGAYDLILHNYGPEVFIGDVNVELADNLSIREAYAIIKPMRVKIFEEYGVLLYVGFYSVNKTDEKLMKIEQQVRKIVLQNPLVLQIHAFTVYEELQILAFDVVIAFECQDIFALKAEIIKNVSQAFPEYQVKTTLEKDFSFTS